MKALCTVLAVLSALLFQGCRIGGGDLREPIASQAIETVAGEKWTLRLEENRDSVFFWRALSDDERVTVVLVPSVYDEQSGRRVTEAEISVLAGFDGAAVVTFENRSEKTGYVARRVDLSFFSRTGNFAPWK